MEQVKKGKVIKELKSKELMVKPGDAIQLAIKKGADLDKLEKLLTLQERWESNQAKKAYHKAMAAFKETAPETILKNTAVDYMTKTGARVKYKHASLAAVVKAITVGLSKNGLSVSWPPSQAQGIITVSCKITHEQGHSEIFSLSAPADDSGGKNAIQSLGSTVSYLQRYTLLSAVGLATEGQDDDGNSAPVECIDDKQKNQILDYIAEKNVDIEKFCKAFGITELSTFPKARFNQAIETLKAKKGSK